MIMGRMMLLFFVISWIIIHLGRKPVRGGSPPRESRVTRAVVVINGVLFHMCDRDSVVVEEFTMNSINIVVVIRI